MAEVFTWRPLLETPSRTKLKVLQARFGDGYRQVVGDGLNTSEQVLELTFRGPAAEIDEIEKFIIRHGGYTPFLWTPLRKSQALFMTEGDVEKIDHTSGEGAVASLKITFVEVPLP